MIAHCHILMVAVVIVTSPLTGCCSSIGSGSGRYNCSHKYQLSASAEPGRRCCIQVAPELCNTDTSCSTMMDILTCLNGTVQVGDCLEMELAPGDYKLPSLFQVLVQYSVVLTAPQGGVNVVCGREGEGCGEEGEGRGGLGMVERGEGDEEVAMMVFNGAQRGDMFVEISGINFSRCEKQIQFDELSSVAISSSTFKGFTGSALNLFNIRDVSIESSYFSDCISSNISRQFRANAGAVSIAYYKDGVDQIDATVTIRNCVFVNNSAFLVSSAESPSERESGDDSDGDSDGSRINQALNTNFFNGRGGGVGIVPQDSTYNVRVRVMDSVFTDNFADTFGGGLFFLLDGAETTQQFHVDNCTFIRNQVVRNFGGGFHVALLHRNLVSGPARISLTHSSFQGNSAYFGGGFCVVQIYGQGQGNEVVVEDTEFVRNRADSVGSAIMFQTFAYVQSRLLSYPYNFTDCSFHENEAPGGTLGAGFVNMNFFGTNQFTRNTGPSLRLVGGLTVLDGSLSFIANRADSSEGGALYIQEFAQLKLSTGAEIEFINNTGRIGSAIVVDVQRSSPVFSELVFNPQCFLTHENATLPPTRWDDVSIHFSGNRAMIGPVVYISHLLHCSWYAAQPQNGTNEVQLHFNVTNFPSWEAFDYDSKNQGLAHVEQNSFDPKFYFQTQPVRITSSSNYPSIRPGQTVDLGLQGMDQFDNPTYIIARVSDANSDINHGAFSQAVDTSTNTNDTESLLRFEPALFPVEPDVGVANVTYGFTERVDVTELGRKQFPVVIDTPFNVIQSAPLEFNMTLSTCQPGYELKKVNNIFTCQCTDSDFYIRNCEEEVIVLQNGLWAGKEENPFPHLDTTVCPTPYCRCHTRSSEQQSCESLYYQDNTEAGQQCHPTRNGTLCGRCVNGTAVGVLRANCRDCEDEKYYALGFLVLGDFILIGAILLSIVKLKWHFPHALKGLLFYIQTVYYTTQHFPISFWDVRKYMLYVSSALGLYFPYDYCLFPGMSAIAAFGFKFIPATLATVMAVIAIVGAFSVKSRNGRKHIWKGVWFLILLLYAPLLHNCVALLHCPNIPDAQGMEEERHWVFDGEVICFRDPVHIFLGLLAILVLIVLVLLCPALFIFTNLAHYRKVKNHSLTVERMLEALTEGYRDSREALWWSSWELFRRLMLISIAVSLQGRSVASAYVVIACFAMHAFFMPYKKLFQNVIELVVLFNYSLLLLIRSTQTFLDTTSSLGYTGTAVPDFAGNGLPENDTVIWLFIPFFYSPLIFAILFSLGALLYTLIKSFHARRKRKQEEVLAATNSVFDEGLYSVYINHDDVTRTEVDGPSL